MIFTLSWWNFVTTIVQKNKPRYYIHEVEESILQALADNEGKSLSSASLIERMKFYGTVHEFRVILEGLRRKGKITRDTDETLLVIYGSDKNYWKLY